MLVLPCTSISITKAQKVFSVPHEVLWSSLEGTGSGLWPGPLINAAWLLLVVETKVELDTAA